LPFFCCIILSLLFIFFHFFAGLLSLTPSCLYPFLFRSLFLKKLLIEWVFIMRFPLCLSF